MNESFDVTAALARVQALVRSVPDFPQPGILFRDITPVLADPAALQDAVMLHRHRMGDLHGQIDMIVGIESRGFLFGVALAVALGVGFVPVRKPGKLPAPTEEVRYALEYGEDALQIHTDAIERGARIVVVDDLLATGGTAHATRQLIERLGGQVMAALFLIELPALGGRDRLTDLRVETLLRF